MSILGQYLQRFTGLKMQHDKGANKLKSRYYLGTRDI